MIGVIKVKKAMLGSTRRSLTIKNESAFASQKP